MTAAGRGFVPRLIAISVLCVVLMAAATFFGDQLPRSSFFLLPSLYYILAICAAGAAIYRLQDSRSEQNGAVIAVVAATVTVLLGEMLILSQGTPTRWLAWGRFPLGDSADFLSSAAILLQQGEFVSIRGRPLANAFIAGVWHLIGYDLALLGLVVSVLCATAVAFYARSALMAFGMAGAVLAIAVAGDFLHEHLAAASTEPIGFFTGTAACAVLLSAAVKRSGWLFALGLGTLALAFMVRAGALFMLPALLLWPAFLTGSMARRLAYTGCAFACVLAAFVTHSFATAHFTPNSPGFVNAPKSWYAIIAMGDEALGRRPAGSVREEARWVQIFDDHPGLRDAPIKEQGRRFVQIVIEAAQQRPLSVVAGAALEYKDQILRAGLFRFIDNKIVRAFAFALFLTGLAFSVWNARRDPLAALLALAGLGLLTSIPFLHGGENRVHIATAGILAGTVGYAVRQLAALVSRRILRATAALRGPATDTVRRWDFAPLSIPVLVLVICLYVGLSTPRESPLDTVRATCPDGSTAAATAAGRGSILTVGRPLDVAAGSVGDGLGRHFEDLGSMRAAREAWLATAAWRSITIYAPITAQALPLPPAEVDDGKGSGLMFVAYLTQDAPYARGAKLGTPLRPEDFRPGEALRCLP